MPQTLNDWVKEAEVDSGQRPDTSDAQRIKELEREVKELRRGQRHPEDGQRVSRLQAEQDADSSREGLHRPPP